MREIVRPFRRNESRMEVYSCRGDRLPGNVDTAYCVGRRMEGGDLNNVLRPATLPWSGHWSGRMGKKGPCWNLYWGDSRKVLGGLRENHYATVLTSPPYFWQRDYKVAGQLGQEMTIDGYVKAICDVMEGVRRVLHPKGVLFLNLGDTYYSGKGQPQGNDRKHSGRRLKSLRAVDASGFGKPKKTVLGMPWRVALAMIDQGWILRSPIIWRRENLVPEAKSADRPWRSYEHVFLFTKSRTYNFCRSALKETGEEDVWTIESQSRVGREHPAVFPVELVSRCLAVGNPSGGPVLDPFAGTATVLRTALDRGCETDGIELNQGYCKSAVALLRS